MLLAEEKKAIEKLSNGERIELISLIRIFKREGIENFVITRKEYVDTVLNLITKLQKENEKKDKRLSRQFKLLNKRDKQIQQALKIAFDYGQADGEHHKAWVIDQMVRALTGKEYDKWINDYIYDEETGDSYTWDKGIAP